LNPGKQETQRGFPNVSPDNAIVLFTITSYIAQLKTNYNPKPDG